ncbi:hypothetical protein EDB19DRAFT_1897871 [Suillus lakei]|nr:hypothetical protein EDB19DRAFT_1897871 [Suillus lakei]
MFERMKAHDYEPAHKENVYYPFSGREEWELTKFLVNNLNQGQITQFLKIVMGEVQKDTSLLILCTLSGIKIETDGYITTHPVHLIWHDALGVTKHIFGNPVFANDMEFNPYEITINGEPEYSEWMSSSCAHTIQACGATLVSIVLASDKTLVTRQTGGLEMHPTFLTIANIRSDVRMKATAHAWSCIAYMPIPEFVCNPKFSSLLQARVWHWCMDIVCQNLKHTVAEGMGMVDPLGFLRYAFTPLCVDPWKVQEFQELAKVLYLSGVQLPFWQDWRFTDPAYFLAPEILHTCHKFFFNHILKWCKEVISANELDAHFHSLHKCIGTRHFGQGVTHVQQMTGQEHRDIQHTIVPTIAGIADADFVCAIRALVDFIYKAQSPTFTPTSIADMASSLQEFHDFKHTILHAEAHRGTSGPIEHFNIPKLELLASFARAIPNLGSIMSFTADVSKCMLITQCKTPFQCMSHQHATFTQQVVCLLDQEESAHQFDIYTLLRSNNLSLNNLIANEYDEVVDMDPTLGWMMHVTPEEVSHFQGPRPVHNHFLKGLLSDDSKVAPHVTVSSVLTDKAPLFVAQLYKLPDFSEKLRLFVVANVNDSTTSHFQSRPLKVWNKFHLQLHSMLCLHLVMPSQQVQAYPPSTNYPFSNCNTMLLWTENTDATVAQVCMVFSLSKKGTSLPPELDQPLLYVQLSDIIAHPKDNIALMMFCVKRQCVTGPNGVQVRVGKIVPLVDVTHAVELVPVYRERANRSISSSMSLECYDTFFLNNFSNKEWYHTLHTNFM